MEAISRIADRVMHEATSKSDTETRSVSCWRCLGVGIRLRDAKTNRLMQDVSVRNAGSQLVAENCLCVRRKANQAQLQLIPPAFGKPKLSRLRPRPDCHPKQVSAITFIRANPEQSYAFYGRNLAGKSHIAWALFREALACRRPAIALTVRDLLDEFRRMDLSNREGDLWTPRVRAVDLRKPGKRWLLFLDEFEKARPSEFASEQLFNLLDAARNFKHQIVITSNMNADDLRVHWSRIDQVWGNSIMTRLEGCNEVEMF